MPKNAERYERVKAKILVPSALAFLLVLGVAIGSMHWIQRHTLDVDLRSRLVAVQLCFQQAIDQDADTMGGILKIVGGDPTFCRNWMSGQEEPFHQHAADFFEVIRNTFGITHLYFHNANQVCVHHFDDPNCPDALSTQSLLHKAGLSGEPVQGICLAPSGVFTVRVVCPWRIDGQLAGYLELAKETKDLTPRLSGLLGTNLAFLVDKKFLNGSEWKKNKAYLVPEERWDAYHDFVVVDRSFPPISLPPLSLPLPSPHPDRTFFVEDEGSGKVYGGGLIPLVTAEGRHVGHIAAMRDVTRTREQLHSLSLLLTLVFSSVGGVLFLLFCFYIDRIQVRLSDVSSSLRNALAARQQTERENRDLEGQLQQSQKMEAIGQLAGGVAHDFNNMLQVVKGYAELAGQQLPDDSPAQGELSEILDATHKASDLVRQLLAFSRGQKLEMTDLDVNEVVSALAKMLRRILGENIALELVQDEHIGAVHADRGQIEQVLLNLCVNARQAMPGGGHITIKTEAVRVDDVFVEQHAGVPSGSYVRMSVTDTGCGMDADTRERIFEPFFTTKPKGEGTGLGLATVYGIVRQHGGVVRVYSEVGRGTVFHVYLPESHTLEAAPHETLLGPVRGGNETVLLAEDEETVRKVAARILEAAGYRVLVAQDGQEALRLLDAHSGKIELAVLDLVMPKLDGGAVCKRAREQFPRMRFLFTSGYAAKAVHIQFVPDISVPMIEKPFNSEVLLRMVREILDAPRSIPDRT